MSKTETGQRTNVVESERRPRPSESGPKTGLEYYNPSVTHLSDTRA